MRLNRTTGLILLVALVVSIGALLVVSRTPDNTDEATATPAVEGESVALFPDVTADAVTRVSVEDTTLPLTVTAARDGDSWQYTDALADSTVDVAGLEPILNALVGLTATDRFSSDDLDIFGLLQPRYVIRAEIDGETTAINIGGTNPAGNRYYAMIDGAVDIHLLPQADVDTVITLMTETPIIQPPTPTPVRQLNLPGAIFNRFDATAVQSLTIMDSETGDSLTLLKDEAGIWAIEGQDDVSVDDTRANIALTVFGNLRAVDGLTGVDVAALGLDDPRYMITAEQDGDTLTVQVGDTDVSGTRVYALVDDFDEPIAVLEARDIYAIVGLIADPPIAPEATAEATTETE